MTEKDEKFVDKLLDAGLSRYSAVEPPPCLEQRLLTALKAAPMSEEPVEKLLDAGLARYSAAEPRPGLEQRILAGLRAQPQSSRWLDWRWAGAFATAAAALVIAILFFRQPPPPEMPPQTASTPAPVARPPEAAAPPVVRPPTVVKGTTRRAQARVEQARTEMPRLETFPAPAPLSEQERLLLRFVQRQPHEALLVAQARGRPSEPLDIAPLPQIDDLVKKPEANHN